MVKASSSGLSSALPGGADTIVARATASGPGALAVVRLSGPDAGVVARAVCPRIDLNAPWRAGLVTCFGPDGEAIDDGIALYYEAPRSYTGEHMVEVVLHGSSAVVDGFVHSCEEAGARRANPGEFTRRAVANGKMDLLQAEAVNDLIQADTEWQLRLAREQKQGRLSQRILDLRNRFMNVLADIEGSLDFVDQGVVVEEEDVVESLAGCRRDLEDLLETATIGERVREGMRVVVSGPVNSGKSTLFNTLLKNNRAITAPHPGTTRDSLEALLVLEGIEVVLIDTAGIREANDPVEQEGVHRARAELGRADVVLQLNPLPHAPAVGEPGVPPGVELIRIASKADLQPGFVDEALGLRLSCVTGEGVDVLRDRLRSVVAEPLRRLEGQVAISARHEAPLRRALVALDGCVGAPREVVAAELAGAIGALREMVGDVTNEAVLDEVFARFCIGK